MRPRTTSPVELTLFRMLVGHVLIGLIASFFLPASYVGNGVDHFWHPGPSAGMLLLQAIVSPIGFIPATVVIAANTFLFVCLIRSLVPDANHALGSIWGFAVFAAGFMLASSLFIGLAFVLWSLDVWTVGPGIGLWLACLLTTILIALWLPGLEARIRGNRVDMTA
jgi:hypothetical protein